MKRIRIIALLVLSWLLAVATPALAGGWGVATLDTLPGAVVAGEPFTVGFMVRQHGTHPVEFEVTPALSFRHTASGQTVTALAQRSGAVGHFSATITLPEPGEWVWTLDAFGWGSLEQPMPALTVAAGAMSEPAVLPVLTVAPAVSLIASGVSLVVAALSLFLLGRTRQAWAAGLLVGAVLVAALSLASPSASPASADVSAPALNPTAEQGRALFLAKGCITCHDHPSISALRREALGDFSSFSTGPDLADRALSAEYLRLWLKDPASLKPETLMPQLNLNADEIEALATLLAADQ